MAKPLHHSSDLASFDTYPSGPELADDPNRLLPEQAQSSPLEEYGAQLGSAAGQAVLALRRAQKKVRDIASEKKATVTYIASARMREIRDEAATRGEQWSITLRERASEWRRQALNALYRARLRAREVKKQDPVHVVIGAGIVGVVIGAGLRIWRASRA
ncbi:MAG TPA: hypothetical protein VJV96_01320 [Candidatus Angelobacter sp.]|nr:hypothetical protein [Candidatus Angelobacter sp.]